MSFLTKSKPSLPDSPTRFGSQRNNPETYFPNKPKDSIMSDLQVFREGLRKELSGKHGTNVKSLDITSPTATTDLRSLYSNQNLNTPNQRSGSYNRDKEGLFIAKGSQSRVDLLHEFSKRGEKSSPLNQYAGSKTSDVFGYFNQSKESQRGGQNLRDIGLPGNKSPFKKESPKREMRLTVEVMKPLDQYRKDTKESDSKSYLGTRASPRGLLNRQKDLKDELSQIFTSRSPITREDYSVTSKGTRDRPKTGLLEQAFRGNADLGHSSSKLGNVNLRGSGISEYKSAADLYNEKEDQQRSKKWLGMELKSLSILNSKEKGDGKDGNLNSRRELGSRNVNKEEVLISDQLPLQRLHEVQDLFYNVTEKGFDNLSPDYIEELVKLSSVIMQKVKGSSYYNRA